MEVMKNEETLAKVNASKEGVVHVNDVTIIASNDLTIDLGTTVDIPENVTIEGNVFIRVRHSMHLWFCPSKVKL